MLALGDSITAGFAMNSGHLPNPYIVEYRGKVYSTGGDSDALTVGNIIKKYKYHRALML
jgi:hypothetical protein